MNVIATIETITRRQDIGPAIRERMLERAATRALPVLTRFAKASLELNRARRALGAALSERRSCDNEAVAFDNAIVEFELAKAEVLGE